MNEDSRQTWDYTNTVSNLTEKQAIELGQWIAETISTYLTKQGLPERRLQPNKTAANGELALSGIDREFLSKMGVAA